MGGAERSEVQGEEKTEVKTTKFQARDHPGATDNYLLTPSLLLEKTKMLGVCVLYVCVRL